MEGAIGIVIAGRIDVRDVKILGWASAASKSSSVGGGRSFFSPWLVYPPPTLPVVRSRGIVGRRHFDLLSSTPGAAFLPWERSCSSATIKSMTLGWQTRLNAEFPSFEQIARRVNRHKLLLLMLRRSSRPICLFCLRRYSVARYTQ